MRFNLWPLNICQAIYTVLEWQVHLNLLIENASVANEDHTLETLLDADVAPQSDETYLKEKR